MGNRRGLILFAFLDHSYLFSRSLSQELMRDHRRPIWTGGVVSGFDGQRDEDWKE